MFEQKRRQLLIDKRLEHKASQEQVAAEVGVSSSYYGRIERGYAVPNSTVSDKLIQLFGLPNNYFTTQKESW